MHYVKKAILLNWMTEVEKEMPKNCLNRDLYLM